MSYITLCLFDLQDMLNYTTHYIKHYLDLLHHIASFIKFIKPLIIKQQYKFGN